MTYEDLIEFFGSEADAARGLDTYRQKVNKWKKGIPLADQVTIEIRSKGKLRADLPRAIRAAQS